ncbi:MAG TPA: hypothetical protein PKN32_04005 [Bacteroidales bacterium]|nr:hypothetical protein [Bacteroidales bacterium]
MKKIIKFLSSLKLTAILVILLVAIMLTGGFLTRWDSIYYGFKEMNNLITLDWFLNHQSHNTAILIWFVVLCATAVLFGINMVLCSFDNLLRVSIKRKNLKNITLFVVHIVFVIILSMHALVLVIGYKQGGIVLTENETYKLKDGYELKLEEIKFIDNKALLKGDKKSHRLEMTLDSFHYKENYAKLTLYKDNKEIVRGEAYIFQPIFGEGFQITLDKFIMDKKTKQPAVIITVGKNPLTWIFFVFYGLGIITMLAYLVVRWKFQITRSK